MTATLEKADEQGLQEHTMNVDLAMMGSGLRDNPRRSGLVNLRNRAHSRGGTLTLENQEQGGFRLRWSIPLSM
jgi:signal transduction histidine kinase